MDPCQLSDGRISLAGGQGPALVPQTVEEKVLYHGRTSLDRPVPGGFSLSRVFFPGLAGSGGRGLGRRQGSDPPSSHANPPQHWQVRVFVGSFYSVWVLFFRLSNGLNQVHPPAHTRTTTQGAHPSSGQCGLSCKEETRARLPCNLHRSSVTVTSVTHSSSMARLVPPFIFCSHSGSPWVFLPGIREGRAAEPYLLCQALLVGQTPAFPVSSSPHLLQVSGPPAYGAHHAQAPV